MKFTLTLLLSFCAFQAGAASVLASQTIEGRWYAVDCQASTKQFRKAPLKENLDEIISAADTRGYFVDITADKVAKTVEIKNLESELPVKFTSIDQGTIKTQVVGGLAEFTPSPPSFVASINTFSVANGFVSEEKTGGSSRVRSALIELDGRLELKTTDHDFQIACRFER